MNGKSKDKNGDVGNMKTYLTYASPPPYSNALWRISDIMKLSLPATEGRIMGHKVMHRGAKFCLFWPCATVANCSQRVGYTVGLGQNLISYVGKCEAQFKPDP